MTIEAVTEWGIRRRSNGEEHILGQGEDGQQEALRVWARWNREGVAADLIVREVPAFHVTFNPLVDSHAICDRRTCLHAYERHFDLSELELGMQPRAACKYCDCMDFVHEETAAAKKKRLAEKATK